MTYNGTHFNVEEVRKMTLKQFLLVGGAGNRLTQDELKEFYKIATQKKDEDGGKPSASGTES